jgi:hypothetical protein
MLDLRILISIQDHRQIDSGISVLVDYEQKNGLIVQTKYENSYLSTT